MDEVKFIIGYMYKEEDAQNIIDKIVSISKEK